MKKTHHWGMEEAPKQSGSEQRSRACMMRMSLRVCRLLLRDSRHRGSGIVCTEVEILRGKIEDEPLRDKRRQRHSAWVEGKLWLVRATNAKSQFTRPPPKIFKKNLSNNWSWSRSDTSVYSVQARTRSDRRPNRTKGWIEFTRSDPLRLGPIFDSFLIWII